jgi:hypothetical protein
MNVAIGTEAEQFPEKEYTNGIFVAVCESNFVIVWSLHSVSFSKSKSRSRA